jgi:hypothetical protein
LGEAYSLAAYRLGEMIKAETKLAALGKASQWDKELLEGLDRMANLLGCEPFSEQIRKETIDGSPGPAAAARKLAEEVAGMRYVLRNAFSLAIEAQGAQEHMRYVDIYGVACVRLVHLLKIGGSGAGWIEAQLGEAVDQALVDLNREWGWTEPGSRH